MLFQFLCDYVLELEKYIPETSIVFVLFTENSIYYGKEILNDAIREQFNAFEMQFTPLDVRQSHAHILLLLLLVSHLLVLLVDFGRDAVLLQRSDVLANTKDIRGAAANVVEVRR